MTMQTLATPVQQAEGTDAPEQYDIIRRRGITEITIRTTSISCIPDFDKIVLALIAKDACAPKIIIDMQHADLLDADDIKILTNIRDPNLQDPNVGILFDKGEEPDDIMPNIDIVLANAPKKHVIEWGTMLKFHSIRVFSNIWDARHCLVRNGRQLSGFQILLSEISDGIYVITFLDDELKSDIEPSASLFADLPFMTTALFDLRLVSSIYPCVRDSIFLFSRTIQHLVLTGMDNHVLGNIRKTPVQLQHASSIEDAMTRYYPTVS